MLGFPKAGEFVTMPQYQIIEKEGRSIAAWVAAGIFVREIQVPQTKLKELLAATSAVARENFVKNVPIAVYPLNATSLASMPSLILEEMGGLDKANYPNKDAYLKANVGGAMALQVAHGKLDAYPIPPEEYASKYQAVPLEEMLTKNPKNAAALSGILGDLSTISGVCGALKTVPTEMVLASALGFPVRDPLKIEAPWGGDQTKDAGKDAYLVACDPPYLINLDESGLSVAYISASERKGTSCVIDNMMIGQSNVQLIADIGIDTKAAVTSKPFVEWVDSVAKSECFQISSIHIQSLDMFEDGTQVGFIKFKADVRMHGKAVPGVIFMRGVTPAVLVVLKVQPENKKFLLTVRQPRFAAGDSALPELPAAGLDDDGNLVGSGSKAMMNEAGIEINESELFNMTQLAQGDAYPGMYTSCGGSDEYTPLFLYRHTITAEDFLKLEDKITRQESKLKLELTPFGEYWRRSPDAKALAALCLHDKLVACGRIPDF
jgi:hypothetical protein